MMLDLQIKEKNPKILLIFCDGELWREVSKSLFYNELRNLLSNLSEEDFLNRFSLLEGRIARRYCIYLLSQRSFLSADLEARLIFKGISPNAARAAIQYCCEKGFLDDSQEIARLVTKELRKGLSAKAVLFKLKSKKRIDESVLRHHLQEAESSDSDVLRKWLIKNAKKVNCDDRVEMRKLAAKLCQKGFSPELVFKELGTLSFDDI